VASLTHDLLPAEIDVASDSQRLFALFFSGAFVDLIVLGLFAQYTHRVYIANFSTAVFAAVVLQVLLKLTVIAEHRILGRLKNWSKFPRLLVAWLILIGSKFIILGALSLAFGEDVHFRGFYHGVVWLILVAVTMLAAEEVVVRFYRRLR